MYIPRDLQSSILSGARQMPVVAVIGPRQSGKSTLVQELFPKHQYLDMQDAELFEFANQDPKGFLASYQNEHGIIIDEAQFAPKLFSQIKVEVDKNPLPGYYILSGSQNFLLHEKISESLAGRVYFYTLLPFSIRELKRANFLLDGVEQQILKGFYPKIYQSNLDARDYYDNYVLTYIERDIRALKNIENLLIFKKFMQLCALRIGQLLSYTDLAVSCGISVGTVKSWLLLLEANFVLFLLPPYHTNFGKRIIKSPKLYFYDVGLAATLMGITKEILVKKRELYGALFENMAIVDLMKNFYAQNERALFTFFRDSNQREIDLIIEAGGKTVPLEIKATETLHNNFFQILTWFQEQIKTDNESVVVYGGKQSQKRSAGHVVSWKELDTLLDLFKPYKKNLPQVN